MSPREFILWSTQKLGAASTLSQRLASPTLSPENYEARYVRTANIDQITAPKFRFVMPLAGRPRGLPVNRGQSRPRGRVEQENINSPSPRVFSKALFPLELSER